MLEPPAVECGEPVVNCPFCGGHAYCEGTSSEAIRMMDQVEMATEWHCRPIEGSEFGCGARWRTYATCYMIQWPIEKGERDGDSDT